MENRENEPQPKDISKEFLEMDAFAFLDFLRSQRKESALFIIIDWVDIPTARRLKAFLENTRGQKRSASIRATEEEKMEEPNVFSSGVKWIKK